MKVGNLVRMDRHYKDLLADEAALARLERGGITADDIIATRDRERVGLVTACVGPCCSVLWQNGVTTRPEITALEIINESG